MEQWEVDQEFAKLVDEFNRPDMNNVRHSVERYNREFRKKNRTQYQDEDFDGFSAYEDWLGNE